MLGLGLADEQGRVAVLFPYPEPARRRLASPPEPRNDFTWRLELVAYSAPAAASPPPRNAGSPPDLHDLLAQLQHPRTVLASAPVPASPPPPPAVLGLDYRVPVTARTAGLPAADASFLYFA
jgi:hypothetical protein